MSTVDGLIGDIDIAEEVGTASRKTGRGALLRSRYGRSAGWSGWLFLLPALIMYAVFVLYPVLTSIQYSFYDWDGIGRSKWVGLDNYKTVFTDPRLLSSIGHAFFLIIFFTVIPVVIALVVASVVREIKSKFWGAAIPDPDVPAADHPGCRRGDRLDLDVRPERCGEPVAVRRRPGVLDQGLVG